MESITINTVAELFEKRLDVINKLMDYKSNDKIVGEIVDHTITDEDKINELESIQSKLDEIQNQSKNYMSQENYDKLYNLRCDIQNELYDLKEID